MIFFTMNNCQLFSNTHTYIHIPSNDRLPMTRAVWKMLLFRCLSLVWKFNCWCVQFVNVFCKNLLRSAMVLIWEVGGNRKWRINGPLLRISHSNIGVLVSGDCPLHIQHIKPVIDSAHLSEAHEGKTDSDKFSQQSLSRATFKDDVVDLFPPILPGILFPGQILPGF